MAIQNHARRKRGDDELRAVHAIKENPKFFFSHTKKLSKVKSSVAPLTKPDGTVTVDPTEKAELLQAQYVSVFSRASAIDSEVAAAAVPQRPEALTDITFGVSCIAAALKELQPHSAAPPGDIPAVILKNCKEALAYPIWRLWSHSMESGKIPESLKEQFITPVYKKGDRTIAGNYRPVSLTSHLSKTFERVIRDRLTDYLDEHNLHSSQQHGFRKNRSTMTQLIAHVDNVLKNLTSGNEVDVIYLDYQKAFDRVDFNVLLKKLRNYGIGGKLLKWLEAFLTGRKQTVVVDGKRSNWESVRSGVPQGSVLGPILFLIYVIDLNESLRMSSSLTFADDTKLIHAIRSVLDQGDLQMDLDAVAEWSRLNNMALHEDKFQLLSYTINQSKLLRELPFTMSYSRYLTSNGNFVYPTPHVKDLGVTLSADGKFTRHISEITRRARMMVGWILNAFRSRSPEVMLTLYKSLVRPILEYCCLVWSPMNTGDIKALESIQRTLTSKIQGMTGLNYWERLEKLGLMSLCRRRERYCLIHVWKIHQGIVPNDVGLDFIPNNRLGDQLRGPRFRYWADLRRANQLNASFWGRAPSLWNKLPPEVIKCETLAGFKSSLGSFLSKFHDLPPTQGYPTVPTSFSPALLKAPVSQNSVHDS